MLEKQYKLAIDARDKLNDNFHKWMTFYYVANGAVLVAITTLYNKSNPDRGILVLSLLGVFICILWHLSCKGYYYWSKNWIRIILNLEKKVIGSDSSIGVYSIFSKEVANNDDHILIPYKPANISTPKLTLLFSFFSIISWLFFLIWQFLYNYYPSITLCKKIIIIILGLLVTLIMYLVILPNLVKSRDENSHLLV